jgi:hypothetical protein
MSRATCRGTRTCSVVEVVDDERHDEPRDEPCDLPMHPDAWRMRSISVATARRVVTTHNGMTGHTARASATDEKLSVETMRSDARHRRSRAGAIRTTSSHAARCSDRTHDKSQCDQPTRSRAARWADRVQGVVEVEPVQPRDE